MKRSELRQIIREEIKRFKEELDPVGKEDGDIDNDGDQDDSDEYLKNRRLKISQAMKNERKKYRK